MSCLLLQNRLHEERVAEDEETQRERSGMEETEANTQHQIVTHVSEVGL